MKTKLRVKIKKELKKIKIFKQVTKWSKKVTWKIHHVIINNSRS